MCQSLPHSGETGFNPTGVLYSVAIIASSQRSVLSRSLSPCSKAPLRVGVAFKQVSLSSDIISEFLEILQDCQDVPSGDEFLLYENYNKHGTGAIIKLWLK